MRAALRTVLFGGMPRPALDLGFLTGVLDGRITFTRAAGSATFTGSDGLIQTAGTNVARFDYDPVSLAARGLLVEEARTNLLLNSTIDGANLATQSVTVAAVAYTLSFYGTGTVTLTGASTAGPLVGSGAYPTRSTLTFTPSAGSLTLTVTGTVQFSNLEAGAFPTSYIPTAGSSVLRAADFASVPVASIFNPAGTLSVEWMPAVTKSGILWEARDSSLIGTPKRMIVFDRSANSNAVRVQIVPAGAAIWDDVFGSVALNTVRKLAVATESGNNASSLDGATVRTNAGAWSWDSSPDRLYIGSTDNTQYGPVTSTQLGGYICRIRYWNKRLSNAQLQALTA